MEPVQIFFVNGVMAGSITTNIPLAPEGKLEQKFKWLRLPVQTNESFIMTSFYTMDRFPQIGFEK